MKLLLDENLSPRLAASLASVYPGIQHICDCGLGSADDSAVWEYAKAHGFVIVSKDSDFAELSVLQHNPVKVIWIRAGNCPTDSIANLLWSAVAEIRAFIETGSETCLILTRR